MIGFVWLFWLCAGTAFVTVGLGSFILLLIGRHKKSQALTVGGGVVFGAFCVLAIVILSIYAYESSPSVIFRRTFGFEVPADVSALKASSWEFADSGHAFLMFTASQTTIDRIIARGLTQAPDSYFPSSNITPPKWWVLPSGADTIRYYRSFSDGAFSTNVEVLIYDRATKKKLSFIPLA